MFIDDEKGLNFLCSLLLASVLTSSDKYVFNIDYENIDANVELLDSIDYFEFLSNISDDVSPIENFEKIDFENVLASVITISESYTITKT